MSVASESLTDYRAAEGPYRQRWTWDSVAWGTHCIDCYPGNCPFRVYVRDGKIVREEQGGAFDIVEDGVPDFNPMGCQKGAAWSQQLYQGDRLMHPLKRVGERGSGQWEQISWDEAATMVADAMVDAIVDAGPQTIVHEGTPEIATVVPTYRFFNVFGGRLLDLHASFNDFSIGLHETFGKFNPVSSADDWFKSELILIWHMNPAFTRIHLYHFMLEARYAGAEVVSISPDLNPSHMHADQWIPMPSGDDVPFALAMVQVILEEGIEDKTFIREQTDLPYLLRKDTGRYLRQTDVEGPATVTSALDGLMAGSPPATVVDGGPVIREDQMYHWDPQEGLRKADRGHLLLDGREVALEGTYTVTLHDGTEVEVEPVMEALKRKLNAEYTPEQQQAITQVHPEVIRDLARKVASKKTNIMLGWNSCKYFHGDLIERAMCLLLGVSGNWGKHGTGIRSWTAGMFDGQGIVSAKMAAGIEETDRMLTARDGAIAELRKADPTLSEELAVRELNAVMNRMLGTGLNVGAGGGAMTTPMAFWWYWQAGYDKRWNTKGWGDDSLPRTFDEYFNEAIDKGWWTNFDSPRPDERPRVLIECGGNMMRRTRGGSTQLLEELWPKLDLIVSIDFRINSTGLYSDLLLPAAQHYEKVGYHIPTPHVMHLTFSDRCADPAGEAKAEWDIFQVILQKFSERAAAKGLEKYTDARGVLRTPAEMWDLYTLQGYFADEEKMADEIVRDCAFVGTVPDGTSLATMREKGHVRFVDWGMMPMALAQASPFETQKTHSPFRSHVELGQPFPTYARRAQFYIDHDWWLEAGEQLPTYKPNPKSGGDHPLRMTSGHNRWSIHSMNMANPVILETHRGEPHAIISVEDAEARGVKDWEWIRVWNDITSFTVRAKVSPSVRPGQIISYNGWDGHQYPDWKGANDIEAGMVKWIAFAGGYGHINYTQVEWQPVPVDRGVPCDFEKAER